MSDTCTYASATLREPLAATAATARTWLLVEQPGPWGAKAVTASHLDGALGRRLTRLTDGTGVRIALIRRPGRHADPRGRRPEEARPQGGPDDAAPLARPDETPAPPEQADPHLRAPSHRVYLAHTDPRAPWVRAADLADLSDLAGLDYAALGAGAHGGFGAAHDGSPLAFVCTNGRRDRCCAVLGRPLATELAASSGPEEVWEVTHLGGHRFAPTLLVLPHGYAYGRMDGHRAKDVLEAARAGRVVREGCRGRSAWGRPGQAAELAVRELTGEEDAQALSVTATEPADRPATEAANAVGAMPVPADPSARAAAWTVTVAHRDGRAWRVAVAESAAWPPRPESCGAALGTPSRMDVLSCEALPSCPAAVPEVGRGAGRGVG